MGARDENWGEKNLQHYRTDEGVEFYAELTDTGLYSHEKKMFVRYFTDEDSRVLDLGCGTGRTTRYLDANGFDVTGVDISDEMVHHARSNVPGVDFQIGDATSLQFEDDVFDYVLFAYCGLDDIVPEDRRLIALEEIRRVLKPGGLVALSSHNSFFYYLFGFEPSEPDNWLKLARFWVRNVKAGQTFSNYKLVNPTSNTSKSYFINPFAQRRQLRACGFEPLDVIGRNESKSRYFDRWPYYVARKPEK